MKWNWQQKDWTKWTYQKTDLQKFEEEFIYSSGLVFGVCKHLENQETLLIELITNESFKTSEVEGEMLNRDSLQSSIRRNFGLKTDHRKIPPAEQGISDMMIDLYQNFDQKLTHKTLFEWHKMLTSGRRDLKNIGKYRTHNEPMQIVSGRLDEPKIHFEAPPSAKIKKEMDGFIEWFNATKKNDKNYLSPLIRAAIAHLYFVSIHPFEDGNGRIARALAVKVISEATKQPLLTCLSTIIQRKKKNYYDALEAANKSNEITNWLIYFSKTLLESQNQTKDLIEFLIAKTKLYDLLRGQLNERQQKVLQRIFEKGLDGFEGGLSAENYIAITKTSRPTATRDLQDLVAKKALIKKGELKGARYYLKII